ncbi:Hypothetical protein NocV09_01401030, partial [Nannochloropsis oceanica]
AWRWGYLDRIARAQ